LSRASAAFTRDGARLVLFGIKPVSESLALYGNQVPTIQVWDVTDERAPRLLISEKEIQPIDDNPFVFDGERQRLATALYTSPKGVRSCVIWNVATGQALERFAGQIKARTGGGQYLLQLVDRPGEGNFYTLIPWATGGSNITVRSTTPPMVSTDRRTAACEFVHGNAPLGLWDLGSGRLRFDLADQVTVAAPRPNGEIDALFSPDGRLLATQSIRGQPSLNLWDTGTGQPVRSFALTVPTGLGDRPILDGSFSSDGKRFAFNLKDRYHIVDVETGNIRALDHPGHRAAIRTVDFSSDGVLVASAGDDSTICLWDAATGQFLATLEQVLEPIRQVAFSPAQGHIAARDTKGHMCLWRYDLSRAGSRPTIASSLLWTEAATAFAFSPDGSVLATGTPNGTIKVRRAGDGGLVTELQDEARSVGSTGSVQALAMSTDGRFLASAEDDGIIRLWDFKRGTLTARLAAHQVPIRALAIGADDLLAVASAEVEIWDIKRHEPLMVLEQHSRPVTALSFSPDGRILATGSEDQTIALWDLEEYRRQLDNLHLDK
jgi:WD40 repeat protein